MDEIIPGTLYLGDIKDALDANLGQSIDRAIAVCTEYHCDHKCADSWNAPFPDGQSVDNMTIHRVVRLIHEGIEAGQRVLIHCAAGISRSPMITACYLYKSGRFPSYDAAFEHVGKCRPKIDPAETIYRSGRSYCATGLTLDKKKDPTIVLA